jgi:hypothetical protein
MSLETRLRTAIAMSLLSLVILTFFFFQQQYELQKCKTGNGFLQGGDIEKAQIINERDSLRDELFIRFTEVSRYETALEILKDQNKKAADEFELILTTQTE